MESDETREAHLSDPLLLRMLRVATRVGLANSVLPFVAQQAVEARPKRGTAIRESPSRHGGIKSGHLNFCQTHWYLDCHTTQYTKACRKNAEIRARLSDDERSPMTLQETIQLGEPVEHRGVVIAPLFPRRQPQAQYVTLEETLPLGFRITEVDEAGSVPELLVVNPLDANVLLYDGEELVGAKSRTGS